MDAATSEAGVMTIVCAPPDEALGVALRLSTYIDCSARALGQDGFQAAVGGPAAASLIGALVTIFVAMIGYRLIVGAEPDVRDGIGWALRLGIVLALVTGWPAFQALAYQVAVDAPDELATTLMPAAGIPMGPLSSRVQNAYDTIRLGGSTGLAPASATTPPAPGDNGATSAAPAVTGLGAGQVPRPGTALVLVLTTLSVVSAFRIGVGFLLAIAPIPILAALFDATLGVFTGWASTLAGAALVVTGSTVIAGVELLFVESEISGIQGYTRGLIAATFDPGALLVIVSFFAVVQLAVAVLVMRSTSLLRLRVFGFRRVRNVPGRDTSSTGTPNDRSIATTSVTTREAGSSGLPHRAVILAGSIAQAAERERQVSVAPGDGRSSVDGSGRDPAVASATRIGLGTSARRSAIRPTRTSMARDRLR